MLADASNLGVKVLQACRSFARCEVVTPLQDDSIHKTRWAERVHILPFLKDGKPVMASVDRVGKMALDDDAILVAVDVRAARFLEAIRASFPEVTAVRSMPAALLDRLDHKGRFSQVLKELGLPEPNTQIASSPEALSEIVRARTLPVIAKPADRAGGVGVVRLASIEDANRFAETIFDKNGEVVVQDFLTGREIGVSVYAEDGEVMSIMTQVWAAPDCIYYGRHDEAEAMVTKLVRSLGLNGPVNFDLREDARGNVFFMECNPRFWSTLNLAATLGFNVVELAVRRAAGETYAISRPASDQRLITLRGVISLAASPWNWSKMSPALFSALWTELTDIGPFISRMTRFLDRKLRGVRTVKPGARI